MAGFGVVPKMPYVHTQVPFGRFGALLAIPSFAAPDSVPQVESRSQAAAGRFRSCTIFRGAAAGLFKAAGRFLTMLAKPEKEGVVVMVIHSLPLKGSPPLLGNGRGGGHGHTHPSSVKLPSSSGKVKGWWSGL